MSYAERQRNRQTEQRMRIVIRDRWTCQSCGQPSKWLGQEQLAHRIANTKANRRQYGDQVIDDDENLALTCCLKCNDAQNIGNKPEMARALADRIIERNRRQMDGYRGGTHEDA